MCIKNLYTTTISTQISFLALQVNKPGHESVTAKHTNS
jgi:hypothetical protein